jgi:hypothetical protein
MPRSKTAGYGGVYGTVKEKVFANNDFDIGTNHCDASNLECLR